MSDRPKASPEVRKIIGDFVRIQRERYGDNWKEILSAEMAAKTVPVVDMLLKLKKVRKTR